MVLQDAWLFTGTIRENIEYGRPGATDDRDRRSRRGQPRGPLRAVPAGRLRHGARQRRRLARAGGSGSSITIARARLAGRSILVLDEATSSVDTRTEVQIRQAMDRLRQGKTSFVIAHRLSTVRDADLILVMDHGRIVEQGTHQQLLAADGHLHGTCTRPSSPVRTASTAPPGARQ